VFVERSRASIEMLALHFSDLLFVTDSRSVIAGSFGYRTIGPATVSNPDSTVTRVTPAPHRGYGRGMTTPAPDNRNERDEILAALDRHRGFLRQTLDGITDAQAAERSTVSELCLGGLVKHVASMERRWIDFIGRGTEAIGTMDEASYAAHAASFRMEPGDSVAALLESYENVARDTERQVRALPSLDVAQPLPEAPWFERGASWSARRVLLHVLAETSQHAGHADIIREAIDGARTMG